MNKICQTNIFTLIIFFLVFFILVKLQLKFCQTTFLLIIFYLLLVKLLYCCKIKKFLAILRLYSQNLSSSFPLSDPNTRRTQIMWGLLLIWQVFEIPSGLIAWIQRRWMVFSFWYWHLKPPFPETILSDQLEPLFLPTVSEDRKNLPNKTETLDILIPSVISRKISEVTLSIRENCIQINPAALKLSPIAVVLAVAFGKMFHYEL